MTMELDDIKKEGAEVDIFNLPTDEEKETPAEPSTEEKTTEEESPSSQGEEGSKKEDESDNTEDEDKNIPFHKHPRFKQLTDENRELKEFKAKSEERLNHLEEDKQNTQDDDTPDEFFVKLYGNDKEAWKVYRSREKLIEQKMEDKILARFKAEQEKVNSAQKESDEYVSSEMQKLKDEGKIFKQDELKKVMFKYKPTMIDANGETVLDFTKGIELLELVNKKDPAKIQARKKIADASTSEAKAEEGAKEVYSFGDFGRHWK